MWPDPVEGPVARAGTGRWKESWNGHGILAHRWIDQLPQPQEAETQVAAPKGMGVDVAIGTPQGAGSVPPTTAPIHGGTTRTFIYRVVGANVIIILGVRVLHPFPQVSRHVMQAQAVGLVSAYRCCALIISIVIGIAG